MKYLMITLAFLVLAIPLLAQTELTRTGETEVPLGGKDIWVKRIGAYDYAFVNAGDDGIRLVNLSTYTVLAEFTDAPVRDLWVRGNYVYVAAWVDTFYVLRTTDLGVEGKLYLGNTNYRGTAVCVSENSGTGHYLYSALWAYLAQYNISDNHTYIRAINVYTPSNPKFWYYGSYHQTKNTDMGECNVVDMFPIWGGHTYDREGWNYLCLLKVIGSSGSFQIRSHRTYEYIDEGYAGYYLQDEFLLSPEPYSIWVNMHEDVLYGYVAAGEAGVFVFPLYPDNDPAAVDDIRTPVVSGWKADTLDTDYRDFHPFGDIGAIANYTPGGKMLYVVDLSNMEFGVVDTTASVDGIYGSGCWIDATRVHVVADSLGE